MNTSSSNSGGTKDILISESFKTSGYSNRNIPINDDGTYTFILGAVNCRNFAGAHYTGENIADLIKGENRLLATRLKNNRLRAEWGHPDLNNTPDRTEQLKRMYSIAEDRECATIYNLRISRTVPDSNNISINEEPVIHILGDIRPTGPKREYLIEKLTDPTQDCCFSIRSLASKSIVDSVVHLSLIEIITFDYVSDGGIENAQKYSSINIENASYGMGANSGLVVGNETIKNILNEDSINALENTSINSFTISLLQKHLITPNRFTPNDF